MAKTFKRMSGTLLASAALAIAGLSGSASAQTYPEYDPWCVNYFKNYCPGRWQVEGFAEIVQEVTGLGVECGLLLDKNAVHGRLGPAKAWDASHHPEEGKTGDCRIARSFPKGSRERASQCQAAAL